MKIIGQEQIVTELSQVFEIFTGSDGAIRPHLILTGPSGTGKTLIINSLAKKFGVDFLDINAAAITKEGTSGNSLSKALSPLLQKANRLKVIFVDEFDKLFISGNSNGDLAHETTNGVQNEFLKVLESGTAAVFGDYGKYTEVKVSNCLFIFGGAFNGQLDIGLDDLRDFGVKTEFLGRVGLVFNTSPLTLDDLYEILEQSTQLSMYLQVYQDAVREDVIKAIREVLASSYDNNTIGARLVNTLVNQYFIKKDAFNKTEKKVTFTKKLSLWPTKEQAGSNG